MPDDKRKIAQKLIDLCRHANQHMDGQLNLIRIVQTIDDYLTVPETHVRKSRILNVGRSRYADGKTCLCYESDGDGLSGGPMKDMVHFGEKPIAEAVAWFLEDLPSR